MQRSNNQSGAHGSFSHAKEDPSVDLFREKNRYWKRAGNNYRLGSNIACLQTQDLDSMDPPKPMHRVHDAGKDNLLHSGHCSWYAAMTEGLDSSESVPRRQKRCRDQQPNPLHLDTTETGNECSPSHPPKETPPSETQIQSEKQPSAGSIAFKASLEQNSTDTDFLKLLGTQQMELMKQQLALSQALKAQLSTHEADAPTATPDASPVVCEGLKGEDTATPAKGDKPVVTENSTTELPKDRRSSTELFSSPELRTQSQRRLKGSVALKCAQRDEGSIRSLIWYPESGALNEETNVSNISSITNAISNCSNDNNTHLAKDKLAVGSFCSGTNFKSCSSKPKDHPEIIMSDTESVGSHFNVRKTPSCAVMADDSKNLSDLISNSFSSTIC